MRPWAQQHGYKYKALNAKYLSLHWSVYSLLDSKMPSRVNIHDEYEYRQLCQNIKYEYGLFTCLLDSLVKLPERCGGVGQEGVGD